MRLQRALETYFEPAAEEGKAGSQQPAPQAPLRQSPHLPDHLREALAGLDDGGLGDLLGFYSGSRDAVLAADNEEYWGTVAAKMASVQALPGSSAKQSELGENLLLLQRLLTEDDEIDDLAYIDRAGAGA